jgi:hypothetical protein
MRLQQVQLLLCGMLGSVGEDMAAAAVLLMFVARLNSVVLYIWHLNQPRPLHTLHLFHHQHHQFTQSSHSINAIGPTPHRGGRKREHRSICLSRCEFFRLATLCVLLLLQLLTIVFVLLVLQLLTRAASINSSSCIQQ